VISHRDGSNAADHAEYRREQWTLIPEQQAYPSQEGGNAGEGHEGEPVPAHARHHRLRLLKIDDDCPHQLTAVPMIAAKHLQVDYLRQPLQWSRLPYREEAYKRL
jgi:hypothetical protein